MARAVRHQLATGLLAALGAIAGLGGAIIVTLNLHIFVGPDDGYMSSPVQVLEHSGLLAAIDVVVLIVGPVLGVIAVVKLRRGSDGST